jgi:cell wall assembly regulator SMI1
MNDREIWEEIDAWLKKMVPAIYESLLPPTSEAEVARISGGSEEVMKSIGSLYLHHNGMNLRSNIYGLFLGMRFSPLIVDNDFGRLALEQVDPRIDKDFDSTKFLPISADNEVVIGFDLKPSSKGKIGQVIFVDSEMMSAGFICGNGMELITEYLDDLKNCLYSVEEPLLMKGHQFLKPTKERDVSNWIVTERWSCVK